MTAYEHAASNGSEIRVTYLLGAGASHGSAQHAGSTRNLLMGALAPQVQEHLGRRVASGSPPGILALVNQLSAIDPDSPIATQVNIEQLITFLDDSISITYRSFAEELRDAFSEILREELSAVRRECDPTKLYQVLIDYHRTPGNAEILNGFLTLNYDTFLEEAATTLGLQVDYGINAGGTPSDGTIRVLKLHGSYNWRRGWPVLETDNDSGDLWIPPGIRKDKSQYPFNAIWGLAREMLDCDILRIIGCDLSPNDWDLVSMLFTTQFTHGAGRIHRIEVVDQVRQGLEIKKRFPYLQVLSLIEIPGVGDDLARGVSLERGDLLTFDDAAMEGLALVDQGLKNPFRDWLLIKCQELARTLPELGGLVEEYVNSFTG